VTENFERTVTYLAFRPEPAGRIPILIESYRDRKHFSAVASHLSMWEIDEVHSFTDGID
jgi:hypothetical protein